MIAGTTNSDVTEVSGLCAGLHATAKAGHAPTRSLHKGAGKPLCALMAKTAESCAQCFSLQCKVAEERSMRRSAQGLAGLCETAVPGRVAETVIAFLHTGQILLQRADKVEFKRTRRRSSNGARRSI